MGQDRFLDAQPVTTRLDGLPKLTNAELDELQPLVLKTLVTRQRGGAEGNNDEALVWTDHTDWSDFSQSLW